MKQVKRSFTNTSRRNLKRFEFSKKDIFEKNKKISKNISKKIWNFFQNLEKLVKLRAKVAATLKKDHF